MKKLLVLGASGRTGRHVVDYALSEGYEVVALVRDRDKLRPQVGLSVIRGSPRKLPG